MIFEREERISFEELVRVELSDRNAGFKED